jgi:hypothetical protein
MRCEGGILRRSVSLVSDTVEYHKGLTNTAIASLHAGEQVNTQRGVFVVGRELLLDLPGIACVSSRAIVCESFRTSELVVGAGSRDDVAMRGDLACKAFYWAYRAKGSSQLDVSDIILGSSLWYRTGHCAMLAGDETRTAI